jgi:aminomethyltransferase
MTTADDPTGPDTALRQLPLRAEHELLGARMTPFGGWSMPLRYSSIIAEHLQVRRSAGLFDVSHMGRLLLHGPGALGTIGGLVAGDLSKLLVGQARYTVLLTPFGGIRDDLIVYRREDDFLAVVNAGTAGDDRGWIEQHLASDTELDDLTELTCLFALQGPRALEVLADLTGDDIAAMPAFTLTSTSLAGVQATLMRTGYTGEEGAELMVANEDALTVWRALLAAGEPGTVAPCGLGARDTLRLEAALPLYGQDMTRNTTPFEARLGWLVDFAGGDFVGRSVLVDAKAAGPETLLVGLATDARQIPRHGDEITVDDKPVGEITSGSYSPVLASPIALGRMLPLFAVVGTEVVVVSRGRRIPARIVERPFYRRGVTPVPADADPARDADPADGAPDADSAHGTSTDADPAA